MTLGASQDGAVELVLDGKTVYLVPTLEVCRELSSMTGGLKVAIDRCFRTDFELICEIVGIAVEIDGHKLNPGQRAKMLPKAIYEAGAVKVGAACATLISHIMNGGKPISDDEEADGEGDEGAPLG